MPIDSLFANLEYPFSFQQESTPNDFTAVGDHHKGIRTVGMDKIAQLDCLSPTHRSQNDRSGFPCVVALCLTDGRAPVEAFVDELADWCRVGGDDGEIFAEVDAVEHIVDHERLGEQAHQ